VKKHEVNSNEKKENRKKNDFDGCLKLVDRGALKGKNLKGGGGRKTSSGKKRKGISQGGKKEGDGVRSGDWGKYRRDLLLG